ncbi:hypothetical protein D9758_012116 [Tetrapyrgos nigripes]|uniref:Uncharacterized protein n=1 Tax=Tetrapyrgos nigripes TaxID=182062 RepID=A0A8H5CLG6_9AGAR|nr:hypothetical protein D9758_012116 [Tetrapyrgos nigripes]
MPGVHEWQTTISNAHERKPVPFTTRGNTKAEAPVSMPISDAVVQSRASSSQHAGTPSAPVHRRTDHPSQPKISRSSLKQDSSSVQSTKPASSRDRPSVQAPDPFPAMGSNPRRHPRPSISISSASALSSVSASHDVKPRQERKAEEPARIYFKTLMASTVHNLGDFGVHTALLATLTAGQKVEGFNSNFILGPQQIAASNFMKEAEADGRRMGGIFAVEDGSGRFEVLARIVDEKNERKRALANQTEEVLMPLKRPTLNGMGKSNQYLARVEAKCGYLPQQTWKESVFNDDERTFESRHCDYYSSGFARAFSGEPIEKGHRLHPSNFIEGNKLLLAAGQTLSNPFGVHWRRIVLERSEAIKNKGKSKSLEAFYALQGDYRWAITAVSPFLHIAPLNDMAYFNNQIKHPIQKNTSTRAWSLLRIACSAVVLTSLEARNDSLIDAESSEEDL